MSFAFLRSIWDYVIYQSNISDGEEILYRVCEVGASEEWNVWNLWNLSLLNVLQELFLVEITCCESWQKLGGSFLHRSRHRAGSTKVKCCLSSGLWNHSKRLYFVQVLRGEKEKINSLYCQANFLTEFTLRSCVVCAPRFGDLRESYWSTGCPGHWCTTWSGGF